MTTNNASYPKRIQIVRDVMRDHVAKIDMVQNMEHNTFASGFDIVCDPEENCLAVLLWNTEKNTSMTFGLTLKGLRALYQRGEKAAKMMAAARKAGVVYDGPFEKLASIPSEELTLRRAEAKHSV